MKKNKEKKFDEILLDLLSSGLGATIILMLIFSLNMSGVFSTVKVSSHETPLPNIGDASLVSKEKQKRKSMSSMRFVTIEGFGKKRINELKDNVPALKNLWKDTSQWKADERYKTLKKEFNTAYQIEVKENSTTFYFFIDHVLGPIEFIIPPAINLSNCSVTAGIIEGGTVLSDGLPNGIYGKKNHPLSPIQAGLSVVFNTGTLRAKNLIIIR